MEELDTIIKEYDELYKDAKDVDRLKELNDYIKLCYNGMIPCRKNQYLNVVRDIQQKTQTKIELLKNYH